MTQMTKKQRLSAYKIAGEKIKDTFSTDGICWALGHSLFIKGILVPNGENMCPIICSYFPEFALFKPDANPLWWFEFPEPGMNDSRLQRLIVLDFCIAMLS